MTIRDIPAGSTASKRRHLQMIENVANIMDIRTNKNGSMDQRSASTVRKGVQLFVKDAISSDYCGVHSLFDNLLKHELRYHICSPEAVIEAKHTGRGTSLSYQGIQAFNDYLLPQRSMFGRTKMQNTGNNIAAFGIDKFGITKVGDCIAFANLDLVLASFFESNMKLLSTGRTDAQILDGNLPILVRFSATYDGLKMFSNAGAVLIALKCNSLLMRQQMCYQPHDQDSRDDEEIDAIAVQSSKNIVLVGLGVCDDNAKNLKRMGGVGLKRFEELITPNPKIYLKVKNPDGETINIGIEGSIDADLKGKESDKFLHYNYIFIYKYLCRATMCFKKWWR